MDEPLYVIRSPGLLDSEFHAHDHQAAALKWADTVVFRPHTPAVVHVFRKDDPSDSVDVTLEAVITAT